LTLGVSLPQQVLRSVIGIEETILRKLRKATWPSLEVKQWVPEEGRGSHSQVSPPTRCTSMCLRIKNLDLLEGR